MRPGANRRDQGRWPAGTSKKVRSFNEARRESPGSAGRTWISTTLLQ